MTSPDVQVENHGSIVLLRPLTMAGSDWMVEHVSTDHMEWAGAIVCEPRYVLDIVDGMRDAGLEVA